MSFKAITFSLALSAVALLAAAAGQRRPARGHHGRARSCAAAPSPTCHPSRRPTPRRARWSASTSTSATAIAKRWGVTAKVTPLSVEARVPEVKLGRVDLTIANLAYTLGRAEQIQFSDPYYLAKEMLAVKASDPGTPRPTSRASASPPPRARPPSCRSR